MCSPLLSKQPVLEGQLDSPLLSKQPVKGQFGFTSIKQTTHLKWPVWIRLY